MSSKQANLSTAFEENIMNWLKKNKFSGFAKNPALREGLMGAGVGGAVGLADANRRDAAGEFEGKSSREKMMEYLKGVGGYGALGGAVGGGLGARKGLKIRDSLLEKQMEKLRPVLAKQMEKVEAAGLTGVAREEAMQKIKKDLETIIPHSELVKMEKAAPAAKKTVEKAAPSVEREIPENTRKGKGFNLADTVYGASEAARNITDKVSPLVGKAKAGLSDLGKLFPSTGFAGDEIDKAVAGIPPKVSPVFDSAKNNLKAKVEELRAQSLANRAAEKAAPSLAESTAAKLDKLKTAPKDFGDFAGFDEVPAFERAAAKATASEVPKVPTEIPTAKKSMGLSNLVPERAKGTVKKDSSKFERMGGNPKPAEVPAPVVPKHQKQREAIQKEYEHHMDLLAKDNYNSTHIRNAQNAKRKLEALDQVDSLLSSGQVRAGDLERAAKRMGGVSLPNVEEIASQAGAPVPASVATAATEAKKPGLGSFMDALKREPVPSKATPAASAAQVAKNNRKKMTSSDAANASQAKPANAGKKPASFAEQLDQAVGNSVIEDPNINQIDI